MPKSKRDKKVSLTKPVKKGLTFRKQMAEEIKRCTENYSCIFTFTVDNMRNEKMKDVRNEWRHSRFFFGKNKVMAYGLGKDPQFEVQKNLHKLARHLKGQCGLLFTNKPKDEVVEWFKAFHDSYYARAGDIATDTVHLKAGPLPQFLHCMEPQLRPLGLPTKVERGVIVLVKDFTVCKKNDILTPEQSRLLRFLEIRMATFRIHLGCVWTNDGNFQILNRTRGKPEVGRCTESEEIEMEDQPTESADDDDNECET